MAALLLALPLSSPLAAQGVSTAGVRGLVTVPGRPDVDVRVQVRSEASGFAVDVRAAGGRFVVQGLEPGGPYTLVARAVGFAPERREGIVLALGELRTVDLELRPIEARLDTVRVVAAPPARGDGGTAMTITNDVLERLPTLDRDLHDFARLVPQLSTRIGLANPGLSAGGVGFRYNNFLIGGVSERTVGGGVSGAFAGRRAIPLAAVQEYQVLLAPYDVRYGDFAGALVNAVTKPGTNDVRGSVFAHGRTDDFTRGSARDSTPPYERAQFGASLGGPIVRDRLHFFAAAEWQHFTFPAEGPFVGQGAGAARPVPVSSADLARFDALMRGYGLVAGSAGPIENRSPLHNLFARADLALPAWNSRLLAWHNLGGSDDRAFTRAATDTFSLSSNAVHQESRTRMTALQLHTALDRAGGAHNELLLWQRSERGRAYGAVQQPIVRVAVPAAGGGTITLNSGTHETAQGSGLGATSLGIRNALSLALGRDHELTLGAEVDRFRLERRAEPGGFGAWSFASLDDLAAGRADRYEVRLDFGLDIPTAHGTQWAAWAGDRWQVSDRLSLTGGMRADLLDLDARAPYNPVVDSMFGRRTDDVPRRRVELSPRLGFTWELPGAAGHRLRGGAGVFASRYPIAWAQAALASFGFGGGTLRCNYLGSSDRYPPPFSADHRAPPAACGGGFTLGITSRGDVDLLDPDLRLVRVARTSLAWERPLGRLATFTGEALLTRALSDVVFVNLNLPAPVATDPHGRVMYGTLGASGAPPRPPDGAFAEVIEVRNTDRNRAWQLAARLETSRRTALSGSLSYTFSRARDVQTPLRVNTRGLAAWSIARATGGRHDDMTPGISGNDIPHRVILEGTLVAPWRRARTELSFYYVGESGRPFTWLAFGSLGRGDLNADGSASNDRVYVPRDARDAAEIQFSGVSTAPDADNSPAAVAQRELAQRAAFAAFIDRAPCLRRQRGRVMERNSCREPWTGTSIASLRQQVPIGRQALELQLDVANVLNLLHEDWGVRREAIPALLEHVGQTGGAAATSRPVFRFDATRPRWTVRAIDSAYQLQLGARYRF